MFSRNPPNKYERVADFQSPALEQATELVCYTSF